MSMCGIAGILRRDGGCADRGLVERMTARIAHRGPDAQGTWHEGPVALGHRRLAIRDLTPSGAQPFHGPDGIVLVYNGELYNEAELERDLARETGFVRRTTCDTELIPAAYAAWGLRAFERFEGMFALALWDAPRGRLVLARDPIGIKPLFVAERQAAISFASELKALLVPGQARAKLSPPDLAHMLALGYPPPDRSLVEGIRQLAPGSVLVADAAGTEERRFWRPSRNGGGHRDLEAATEAFLGTFPQVVSDQLISDVPIGVLQSGGIDSSLVSLSLPAARDVPLFSVRFAEATHDESTLASSLARSKGRRIVWIDLPAGADAEQDFRAVVDAVDGQLADSSTLAVHRLCRVVREHVTVALSGDGGDEFFGGYPTYAATRLASRVAGLLPRGAWAWLAEQMQHWAGVRESRIPAQEKAYRFFAGLAEDVPHAAWRHYLPRRKQPGVYGSALAALSEANPLAAYSDAYRAAEGDPIDRGMLADQAHYLPADMLVKVDRASMAHGLEVRVPFLDRRIMELAGSIHNSALVNGSETKRVLRRALKRLGGPSDVVRSTKRGFNIPMNRLLRQDLRALADRLLDADADIFAPYFSPDGVRGLWRDHREGRIDEKYALWTLLTIGVWRERESLA